MVGSLAGLRPLCLLLAPGPRGLRLASGRGSLNIMAPAVRFTRARPCPVCGGWDQQPRGQSLRCYGYLDSTGEYARCTREDHAGDLEANADSTYSHRLTSACRCGTSHGLAPAQTATVTRTPEARVVRTTEFPIRAMTGQLVATHVRFDLSDGGKRFQWRLANGAIGLNGTPVVQLPLYATERLAASPSRAVVVTEGERAADALNNLGILAVGTITGAATTPAPDVLEPLRGRPRVVLWPDADTEGVAHMQRIAQVLVQKLGIRAHVVEWPEAPAKGDAADFVAAGRSIEEVRALLGTAQPFHEPDPDALPAGASLEVTWASDVKSKPIEYLWRGRLAVGKVTNFAGDPAVGKGTLGADVAAHLTTGRDWPDGQPCPICGVFLLTGEDAPEDTIVPRLQVAGADCTRVGIIGRVPDEKGGLRRVSLDTDAELVVRTTAEGGGKVLIIDPASSYLGADTNSWRDSDMRRILDPLSEAAARYGVAVILVAHLNKAGGNKAMYRFQGSIASVAAARFAFLIGQHPDDPERRVLACVKSNLGAKPASLAFRIVSAYHDGIRDEVGRVEWAGTTSLGADDLVGSAGPGRAVDQAGDFLRDALALGPVLSDELKATAASKGIGKNSLWDAKSLLRVRAHKDGLGSWYWSLPAADSGEEETEV